MELAITNGRRARPIVRTTLLLLAALVTFARGASAQTTGTIQGVARTEAGSALEGATVVVVGTRRAPPRAPTGATPSAGRPR
jgi:hypothetical protein